MYPCIFAELLCTKKNSKEPIRHVCFLCFFWFENWVTNHQLIDWNHSNLNLVNGPSHYKNYSEYCPTACSKMAIHEGTSCLPQSWIFWRMIKNVSSLCKLSGATAQSCWKCKQLSSSKAVLRAGETLPNFTHNPHYYCRLLGRSTERDQWLGDNHLSGRGWSINHIPSKLYEAVQLDPSVGLALDRGTVGTTSTLAALKLLSAPEYGDWRCIIPCCQSPAGSPDTILWLDYVCGCLLLVSYPPTTYMHATVMSAQ